MFEIDPDKPNVPAIARILSLFGVLSLMASVLAMLLAFSGYEWVNETYAIVGAIGAFLLALVFVGQAKTLELLALVSARVKSRFAVEAMARAAVKPAAASPPAAAEGRPAPNKVWSAPKERVISIPEQEARKQGL